jgi:Bacterial SH3 domain
VNSLRRKLKESAVVLATACALAGCASSRSGESHDGVSADGRSKGGGGKRGSSPNLSDEVARLRIERDRLAQANLLLEQELAEAHEDLKRVERQFVVYEERLVADQGKAAAVAASAEARIRFEKLERDRPGVLNDSTELYVKDLIGTSQNLIRKQNYGGALFFAERANHTMSSAERRASIESAAVSRTVSVNVANVREGPGQHYSVVERINAGAVLVCWGEANQWYHVRTPKGADGWIHASVVR